MKDTLSTSNEINFDEAMLYTPGRGRNTWSIYFLGKNEQGDAVGVIFHLNISSIPMGLRYLQMYDTVLAINSHDKNYLFGRDYGEMRNKHQMKKDTLSFECNCSKFLKDSDELLLTAYIPHVCAKMSIDYNSTKAGLLKIGDFFKCRENIIYQFATANTDSNSLIELDGICENVKGTAWVEKKYVEFPKGRIKKTNTSILKINLIPYSSEKRYTLISVCDKSSAKVKSWIVEIKPDGTVSTCEVIANFAQHYDKAWVSGNTGKNYPLPLQIRIPDIMLDVSITPGMEDQEVYSPYKRNREGEYMGTGVFEGTFKNLELKGMCTIEISEDK